MDDHRLDVFFDVHCGLPRQGPGDAKSTRKALRLCRDLPSDANILDIGCGPGAQTVVIAEALPEARITAIDAHEPYLKQLQDRAKSVACDTRISAQRHDMSQLPFTPGSFDLVWAEGSAYIMGVSHALRTWRPLLQNGGYIALTELVWLTKNPPAKASEFFTMEYPDMTTPDKIVSIIAEAGYQTLDHFTLPDHAWWDDYYTPLSTRLQSLEKKYAGDEAAMAVIELTKKELAIREQFSASYGYEFFVARK